MIPQNLVMSRDARRILTELDTQANKYNINIIIVPTHAYIADQLALKYYTNAILNAIRSKIKNMRKKQSKHFSIEYWVKILDTMFSYNPSVVKDKDMVIDCQSNQMFNDLSTYLITDYSGQDARTIYELAKKFDQGAVYRAITIARENNVIHINYVRTILEREAAEHNAKVQKAIELGSRAEKSGGILKKEKHEHTIMDMATADYNWQEAKANADIERMFDDLYGGT